MKKTIFLILLVLVACTNLTTQNLGVTPETTEQAIQPNSRIVLREALGLKDIYAATGIIDLELHNKSDNTVLFPSDFGAEIFLQKGTEWEKVNNSFGYSNYDQVLPISSDYPPGLVVPVAPDLAQITVRPIVLRINVKGTLSDSGKEVEAYLDVTIE
jgi:hypothetical protein